MRVADGTAEVHVGLSCTTQLRSQVSFDGSGSFFSSVFNTHNTPIYNRYRSFFVINSSADLHAQIRGGV